MKYNNLYLDTLIATLLGLAILGLSPRGAAAATAPHRAERARLLMGTVCRITAYGADREGTATAVEAALSEIAAVEAVLSTWRLDTEMSRVNRMAVHGPVTVSPLLEDFLLRSLELAERTGGAYDPSVGALVDAWDLRGEGRIPTAAELERALRAVGHGRVALDARRGQVVFLAPGLWIDTGGSGKGFALDRAAQVLRREGIASALLDFGGQLLAMGAPPGESVWTVAVADPKDRERPALVLELRDASLATSSQSERSRQVEGRHVGHILDPRTGAPVERWGSVTVRAPDATAADGLSTALFVLGPEEGLEWARRSDLEVGYLEVIDDGLELRATAAFRSRVVGGRAPGEPVFLDQEDRRGGAR
jgi:FAD:protein FMN transferase